MITHMSPGLQPEMSLRHRRYSALLGCSGSGYRAPVWGRRFAALAVVVTIPSCSHSPSIAPIGGDILIQLHDSAAATRQAVQDACGHLPGVKRVIFLPNQPSTLRFDIPPASEDKKNLRPAIWACLHRLPEVVRAVEPL